MAIKPPVKPKDSDARAASPAFSNTPELVYDSNPFTNSFNALGKMFKFNQTWAIVLIALTFMGGVLNFGMQGLSTILDGDNRRNTSSITSRSENNNDYWTKERMRDAKPAPMPTVRTENKPINWALVAAIGIIAFVIVCIFILISAIIQTFIGGMLSYVALRSQEGRTVQFSEAWQATTSRFGRLFGATLLAQLKIFGWFLLFIIPGIIASLRYAILPYVIMDEEQGKGVGESHERTKSLVKGRLWEVFGISTVGSIIPFIGQIVTLNGNAALYRQLQVYGDKNIEKPKIHWLNYLGLIIFAAILALMLLIGGIILAAYLASHK